MNNIQKYLIAKYVPDMHRMEPTNIGVIVWARGRVSSVFLSDDEASPHVNEVSTYKRWVSYWKKILQSDTIKSRTGESVSIKDDRYVEELIKTQKGNYLLSDAGVIVEKVTTKNINVAAQFIFDELVARKGKHHPTTKEQAIQLKYLSNTTLRLSGVTGHDEFQQTYPVICRVGLRDIPQKVHYAIGNGTPRSVFQRVQIATSQSVLAASFLFEHIATPNRLKKANCASLIYADETEMSREQKSSMEMLSELSTVVNLRNQGLAKEILAEVASSAGDHS